VSKLDLEALVVPVKTKSFLQNATDTFKELAAIFIVMIVLGGVAYSLVEGKDVLDGIWWAFVTAFTVGYGDVVPGTMWGRLIAVILMSLSIFVIVPLVTALMTKKMVVDDDSWTAEEQRYVLASCRRFNEFLDELEDGKELEKTQFKIGFDPAKIGGDSTASVKATKKGKK
jgi:voltage-gated potassium channel